MPAEGDNKVVIARGRSWLTADRLFRLVLALIAIAATAWLVRFFSALVLYLFVGFILGYIMNPAVDSFQRWGMSRVSAVVATSLALLVLLGFLLAYLVPFVARHSTELLNLVSRDNWFRVVASIDRAVGSIIPLPEGALSEPLQRAYDALFEQERLSDTVSYMVGLFTNLVYALLIVPFTMFFVMKDGRQFRDFLLRIVPNRYFELTVDLIQKIETNIGAYFRALLMRGILVSIVASVLLALVGLRSAVGVGIFTGVANTIPYFGPILGFLGGAVVAIGQTGDLSMVLGIAIAMAIVQALDNILFQPLIFSRAARAHPIVVLVAVLVGAEVGGILGMLLSIPVLTIAMVTTRQILWGLRNYHIFRATQ